MQSRKGIKLAKCTLCCSDFSVSHGGFNDVTRHVNGIIHVENLREAQNSHSFCYGSESETEDQGANLSPIEETKQCRWVREI